MSQSQARIARTREVMTEYGIDVLYVRNISNIMWLTGFLGVFDSEPAHVVLITQNKVVLHTDSRYSTALRRCACGTEIEVDDSKASFPEVLKCFIEQAGDGFANKDTLTIGIEDTILLREWEILQADSTHTLQITTNLIEQLRAEKDATEIEALRQAQAITDQAFAYIITYMNVGTSSSDIPTFIYVII